MSLLLAALAVLVLPRRIVRARGGRAPTKPGGPLPINRVAAAGAALVALWLVPMPAALGAALAAGAACWWLAPRSLAGDDVDAELALARGLPDSAHLLAALLRTGCTDQAALRMAAAAAEEPLRGHLAAVAGLRALGADAGSAWRQVAHVEQLRALADLMSRHGDTGAAVAAELDRLGAKARDDFFTRGQAAARAAAVRAVLPLAACFLPAFFLLGVVPIVAALGSQLRF